MRRRARKNTRRGWSTKAIIMKNWTQTLGKCKRIKENYLVLKDEKFAFRSDQGLEMFGEENFNSDASFIFISLFLTIFRTRKQESLKISEPESWQGNIKIKRFSEISKITSTNPFSHVSFQALKLVTQVNGKLFFQQVLSSNANDIERLYRPENWYMVILFCCLFPLLLSAEVFGHSPCEMKRKVEEHEGKRRS